MYNPNLNTYARYSSAVLVGRIVSVQLLFHNVCCLLYFFCFTLLLLFALLVHTNFIYIWHFFFVTDYLHFISALIYGFLCVFCFSITKNWTFAVACTLLPCNRLCVKFESDELSDSPSCLSLHLNLHRNICEAFINDAHRDARFYCFVVKHRLKVEYLKMSITKRYMYNLELNFVKKIIYIFSIILAMVLLTFIIEIVFTVPHYFYPTFSTLRLFGVHNRNFVCNT